MFRFVVLCLCVSSIWALPSDLSKFRPFKHPGPRIINGEQAVEGQFPFQAGLFISANDGYWFCAGSIIGEEWILTAGHCVDGAISIQAATGTLNPYQGALSNGSEFILHEEYDEAASANDIGLIKLETPLQFDANTAAVSLAKEKLDQNVDITVSGWGTTSDSSGSTTNRLNFVELMTINNTECNKYYGPGGVLPEMVCAVSPTSEVRGTCLGDSGGPALVYADSVPIHVAIVSFVSDQGCESGIPSGYIRTAYYQDWIKEKTGI